MQVMTITRRQYMTKGPRMLLCLMLLAAETSLAQLGSPTPASRPVVVAPIVNETIRRDINEVTLVFSVARKKQLVRNVVPEDLTVLDDGRPVTQLTYFAQQTDLPLKIVILLDISGSMRERFRLEREVAEDFLLRLLRPQDTGMLLAFNDKVSIIESSAQAMESVAQIRAQNPRGGTAIHDAVRAAAGQLRATGITPSRKAILLVTDGNDNASRTTAAQAVEAVLRAEAVVFVVNTAVGLNRDMRLLARETGGQVWNAFTRHRVAVAFRQAENSLRSQYVLGYRPPEFVADGRFHRVKISVRQPGLQVYCRKGYFASEMSPQDK